MKPADAVRRVRKMAVLLILQGAFEATLGLAFTVFAVFLLSGRAALTLEGSPAEVMTALVLGGPGMLGAGGLKIAGGIRNYSYRGKLLGILALASGGVSVLTCVCAPTAVALLVYGLKLYGQPQVERAFLMGEQGSSPEWIQAFLGGGREPWFPA